MSRLVAVDCETTGLDPDVEDVFEVAIVDITDGGTREWRICPRLAVVDRMHPKAAEVNRYHERTRSRSWWWDDPDAALHQIAKALDGAHIVGAVPDFDTRHLTSLYRRFGLEPPRWHYHLIDIEVVAVGWIMRERAEMMEVRHVDPPIVDAKIAALDDLLALPYKSDDLAAHCGVEPPSEDQRHTALGDARWVARWYRTLTGEAADG